MRVQLATAQLEADLARKPGPVISHVRSPTFFYEFQILECFARMDFLACGP